MLQNSEDPPAEREERGLLLELREAGRNQSHLQKEALHLQRDILLYQKQARNLEIDDRSLRKGFLNVYLGNVYTK